MIPRIAQRASRRVGLMLPAEPLLGTVIARLRRSTRWSLVSFVIGFAAGVAWGVVTRADADSAFLGANIIWSGVGGALLGGSVGAVLSVLTERRDAVPELERVARPRPRVLRDYVDPFELNWVRVTAVLGLSVPVAAAVAPGTERFGGPSTATALGLGIAGAVTLGILEIAGRRVVLGRARIAGSDTELAWDDALRAEDLRRLVSAVAMTSIYALIFGGFPLVGAALLTLPPILTGVLINVGAYLLLAAAIVVLVIAVRRDSPRHYLRVLWPELAARYAARGVAPSPTDAA
ncbi:MAG: hypothetical protein DI534_09920 [Leifsonia xyli]|nr:MAG: hypothetical protein DI534_09920 [Leifsonia xyli]